MKSSLSNRFLPLLSLLVLSSLAPAASINFAAPATVAGDTDVSTAGSFVYAYNWANSTKTVNGVTFTGTNSNTTVGTNLTLTQWKDVNTSAFSTGSNPFAALSANYKGMLVGSTFNNSVSGSTGTNTVTLNNLTIGHQYAVQFWVGDARGSTRTETLSSPGGNSVSLAFCTPTSAGGLAQYSIGTFTADAATQAFTVTATTGSVPQMNAMQVRDLGIPGVALTPSFSLNSGTFVANGATMPVTLTSESGATIYYTMDGNDPTTASSSGASPLVVNIAVPATVTLKAMAAIGGKANSDVAARAYTTVQGTGTWTNTAGGSWTTGSNWLANFIPNGTDLTANFATLGLSADTTVTLDGPQSVGNLVFDDQSATKHAWTIAGDTLTLAGSTPMVTANVNATISSILAGSAAITKNGAGKLTLTGANTLTGNVSVTQGTLELGTNGVLDRGLTVSGTAANNATFNLAGGSMTLNNVGNFNIGGATEAGTVNISNGSLALSGGSELTINNTNGATATWNQTGGTVSVTTGNHIYTGMGTGTGVTTTIGFSGDSSFTVNASNTSVTFTLGGRSQTTATISGNAVVDSYQTRFGWGGDLTATDGGTLNLDGGIWKTNRIYRDVTVTTSAVNFNGGILQARQGSTGFMSGLGSANVKEGGAKIDTNTFDITIAQPLLHGGVAATDGGLVKSGDGGLTLTGASTYTGPTTVNQGTLTLGAGGSISASPVITVASGATLDGAAGASLASGQTLQGEGVVQGNMTIGAGATLSPGIGGIGTLEAYGNLTLAGTANFEIRKFGATLTHDTVSGFQSVTYGGTLKVTASGDALALNDTFQLFDPSGGTMAGSFAAFDLPALPAGRFWDTTGLLANGTIKVSTVSYVATPFFSLSAGGYIGAQSVTITSDSGSTIHYSINGIGQAPVASPATVPVPADASMTLTAYASKSGKADSPPVEAIYNTVATPTWAYESSGSWTDSSNWNREVVGTGSGVTADFSTLELSGDHTVSLNGPRTIGSLAFGDTAATYGWTLAPGTGGALTLDNGANAPVVTVNNQSTTISTVLTGSNGLTKAGAGTLRLTAANTYAGATTVNGGTLEFATPGLLTYSGGQININNGSTVKIFETGAPYRYDFGAVTYNFGATGGGTINTTGTNTNWVAQGEWTFKTNGGAKNTVSGGAGNGMNLNGKSVVFDIARGTDPASDLDVTIAVANTVGSLAKTGAGIVTLGAANNYTGTTTVNQGTLLVNGSLAAASAVAVASGATVGGSGSIGGTTIASGAFVAPGTNGTGTLTVGSATLGGTYLCQLGATAGDEVIVTGVLTANPGAAIAVSTIGTPTAASYTIATYGSLAGTLPTVTGIPSGYSLNTATSGEIKLVKTGGFVAWADNFAGLTDKTPGGDPDHDGISNLMEYVIGGDPRVSSIEFLAKQAVVGTDLVITYKRSDDSEADTTQEGQWSTNLGGWNAVAPVLVNENDTAPDDMKIVIPMSNAVGGKLFGRLQVTQP